MTSQPDSYKHELNQRTTTENNGGKTGWPPGLLQDDSRSLSKWFSNKPDAKQRVREALIRNNNETTK